MKRIFSFLLLGIIQCASYSYAKELSTGVYYIYPKSCRESKELRVTHKGNLILETPNEELNQQWYVKQIGPGKIIIKPFRGEDNDVVTSAYGSLDNGTEIIAYNDERQVNQIWIPEEKGDNEYTLHLIQFRKRVPDCGIDGLNNGNKLYLWEEIPGKESQIFYFEPIPGETGHLEKSYESPLRSLIGKDENTDPQIEISIAGKNNGQDYVDIGMPVMWAAYNLGASSPREFGDAFAKGELFKKDYYSGGTYKYENDYSLGDISGSDFDAAKMNWGGNWRMPTEEEVVNLLKNCKWEWIIYNGVSGYKVTGWNGNSIFLPSAGHSDGKASYDITYYRSSTPTTFADSKYARENAPWESTTLRFGNNKKGLATIRNYIGAFIRPVCDRDGMDRFNVTPSKIRKELINGIVYEYDQNGKFRLEGHTYKGEADKVYIVLEFTNNPAQLNTRSTNKNTGYSVGTNDHYKFDGSNLSLKSLGWEGKVSVDGKTITLNLEGKDRVFRIEK